MVCVLLSGLASFPERIAAAQGEASFWERGGLERENFDPGRTNLLAETNPTFPRLFCFEAEIEFSDDFESHSDAGDRVGQSQDKPGIFSHFLFGSSKSALAHFISNLQNRTSVPLFVLFHSWKGFTA